MSRKPRKYWGSGRFMVVCAPKYAPRTPRLPLGFSEQHVGWLPFVGRIAVLVNCHHRFSALGTQLRLDRRQQLLKLDVVRWWL